MTLVAASGGYPGKYEKGQVIEGLDGLDESDDLQVFHAGTAKQDERTVTSGGRVLALSACASSITKARARAYAAIDQVRFEGMFYRRDIGVSAGDS